MKSDAELLLEKTEKNADGSITLREDVIREYSAELADFLMNQTRTYKDFGMASATLKQLIELKKAFWPATQKNITGNVSDFNKLLDKWKETRAEVIKTTQVFSIGSKPILEEEEELLNEN